MLLIENIAVYNTALKSFEVSNVYMNEGRVWAISLEKLRYDTYYDGTGKYLLPGFIDAHMHIESSMTTPPEFSNTVLPKGTTTVLADAHEVANALGYDGLEVYMDSSQPLDIYYAIPSSVPSTNPELETTGGIFTEHDVSRLCQNPKIRALGEIMNFKDVVSHEDSVTKRIVDTFQRVAPLLPIEGHIPRVTGMELARYAHRGIGSDHTHQTVASLLEKTRMGFLVQIQEKSMHRELIEAIETYQLYESVCFVTDDVMPDHLVDAGHMDHLIRKAVKLGMRVEDAIYAATAIPARRMLLHDRGIIAPGKKADAVIVDNLETLHICDVIKSGEWVSKMPLAPQPHYPEVMCHSLISEVITKSMLKVNAQGNKILLRVIEREETTTFTHEVHLWVNVVDGDVMWQEAGLSLLCVKERYGNHAPIALGFVKNGFDKRCAIATSWAHDHHNILAMGTNIEDLVDVMNGVIAMNGGMMIRFEDQVEKITMPFGGVVSLDSMENLADKTRSIRAMMRDAGYRSHNEIMSFCVLSLLVSPNLKISDKGYVDVKTQTILPWWVV